MVGRNLILVFCFLALLGCSPDTEQKLASYVGRGHVSEGEEVAILEKHRFRRPYLNGLLHGTSEEWYASGQLYKAIPFKNGKKNGVERRYHDNGQILLEMPWKNGQAHGTRREFSEAGNQCGEFRFVNGEPDGPFYVDCFGAGTTRGLFRAGKFMGVYDERDKLVLDYGRAPMFFFSEGN